MFYFGKLINLIEEFINNVILFLTESLVVVAQTKVFPPDFCLRFKNKLQIK